MKQLEVQIMGQRYVLGCPPGGESRLLEAVERVDTAMCIIRDGGKVRARDRIAVLAAVNLAFDLGENSAVIVASGNGAANGATQHAEARRASSDADDNAMLSTLLERLDSALGEDGQLI